MTVEENKAIVQRYWDALAARDWEGMKALLTDDAHYTDVPAPEDGARGPDAIEARLRLGIEPLERYVPRPGTLTAEDDRVILEHSEEWHWHTGEHVVLPFVSVFELRDGKIARWWDYWDLGTLMNAAPQWWLDHIMKGYQ